MTRTANELLDELLDYVAPPRGCAIYLVESESRDESDTNWTTGAPVMPMTVARPVRGNTAFINSAASRAPSSTFEIARATARASPATIRLIRVSTLIKSKLKEMEDERRALSRLSFCLLPFYFYLTVILMLPTFPLMSKARSDMVCSPAPATGRSSV